MSERELILLGACLASQAIADRMEPRDFVDNDNAQILAEIKAVLSGDKTKDQMDRTHELLNRLCPNTAGSAIDRLVEATKLAGLRSRVKRAGERMRTAANMMNKQQIEQLIEELSNL